MNQRLRRLRETFETVPAGWWAVLLALPALVPLARVEFFASHDGLLHAHRLTALSRAVRAGVLYPRWFPEFAFGYGHPVLNFYGPLSYYWGLPFTLLGADPALALKLVFASGLLASALGMYRFARLHLDRGAALVAAAVYAYLPYHLADLYVRGAVAEFLAFAWLPWVLWAFHRLTTEADRLPLARIALATLLLAALVLTHSLSAFLFAPVLAIYVLILLLRRRDRRLLGRVALALALALTLTAFHWLPILAESRYVGLGHGASQGYRDHLLPLTDLLSPDLAYPYPTEAGGPPTFPLGLVQIAIAAAAVETLLFRPGQRRWPTVFFLALALLSAFMLTTTSLPVWKLLEPVLAFLQYPWRFQLLTALATAFLAGALLARITHHASRITHHVLRFTLYAALLASSLWHLPVTPVTPDLSVEAMWQRDREFGQVGATWTGEYLPIWVEEQRWAISRSALEPAPTDTALPAGQVALRRVGYNRYDLSVNAPEGTDLALHQFHYPGWQAVGQIGNVPHDSRPAGVLGLAAFDLTAGRGPVTVCLGLTPWQRWGSLVSLVTALALAVALVARYQLARTRDPLWLAACYALLAALLSAHLALPNGYTYEVTAVNANLEDTAELLGFTTGAGPHHPGDVLDVTLYWRALRAPALDYKAFVHLTDAALTRQPAQHDGDPGGGYTPTTRWLAGELVPDSHPLALPAGLAPGRYRLWAGLYEPEPLRNLAILSTDTAASDGRVLLGEIEVVAP